MSYKAFRMDTTAMSVEHRNELLDAISKCIGVGWWSLTGEPFIFKLTWDHAYPFEQLVTHSDECTLTPWESY